MQESSVRMSMAEDSVGNIEVLDLEQLDEATGGLAPLLAAAAWGFGVGFAGTAALIAGAWAAKDD
jgi:hypothetical protein